MELHFHLRILITLSFLAFLSACGSSHLSPPSTAEVASTGTAATSTKPIVKCNKAGSATLSYKVAAQVSGSGYDPNFANVFLSNLPTGFEAGTSYIQFWKGYASSDSVLSYASTALSFALYDKQTASFLNNSSLYTSLAWNDVKNLISGATPTGFMARVIFVIYVQDPTSQYQVLSVSSYNTSDNTNIENQLALLPTFYASPSDYAVKSDGVTVRETVLKNLHPLRGMTGDFATLANNICL